MSTSTFSYAQAAKGQLPAQTVTAQQSSSDSQAPSVTGNPSRETNATNTSTRAPSVAVSTSSHENDDSRSARSTSAHPDAPQLNGAESIQDDTTTATSVAGSVTSSKVALDQTPSDEVLKNTETQARSIITSSDVGELDESKKGRKAKKSKSADKDTDAEQEAEKSVPPPKVELSDAPIPSVNPWVQRQQAAKAKAVDSSVGPSSHSTNTSVDIKARPSLGETGEGNRVSTNGKQGPKRDGEPSRSNTNHGARRAPPRGVRGQAKESDTNLVATNPASWPTPETAAVNAKAQPQPQPEKVEKEKESKEESAAKPKGKSEWVKMHDFVPTVKFETQIPPNRGPRGGGRPNGSRGGRDATGNHPATVGSNDRSQETTTGFRTNAGPKRVPTEGSGQRDGRRHNHSHAEHPKTVKESTSDTVNGDQHKINQHGFANGTTQESLGQASMLHQQPGENVKNSDSHKDARTQSHKEHHPQNQSQNGSNHRGSERGRGSGRARGGFNSNNGNGMSHYGQNAYGNQHHTYQFPPGNSRHANHYGVSYPSMHYQYPAQPAQGQRKPANGNRRQGGARAPAMASMNAPQYDPNTYHMPNVGLAPFDGGNLAQLAQQQVEYYFSVDNIVKDLFLRKHMDGQGFVPLSVIHNFKRMQNISPDIGILRQACHESSILELAMGGDGMDRVRMRIGWDKWVLKDMSERHPAARHDGSVSWQPFMGGYPPPMMSPQYPGEAPPMFSPTNEHAYAHYANGNYGLPMNMPAMNGSYAYTRPQESQLSATVPEFSPSAIPALNGLKSASVNGSEDKKATVQAQVNGVSPSHEQPYPMTNGVAEGQPEAFVNNSQIPNGVGYAN